MALAIDIWIKLSKRLIQLYYFLRITSLHLLFMKFQPFASLKSYSFVNEVCTGGIDYSNFIFLLKPKKPLRAYKKYEAVPDIVKRGIIP